MSLNIFLQAGCVFVSPLSGPDFVAVLLSELQYCLLADAYLSKYGIVLKEKKTQEGKGRGLIT